MNFKQNLFVGIFAAALTVSNVGFATRRNPPSRTLSNSDFSQCLDKGQPIPVDNAQVLKWEDTTRNQFLARGHVEGKILSVYPDHSGHEHFSVQIGATDHESIEVVYSQSFGALPALNAGDNVEACGDYITSTAPTTKYPSSPDGAVLHWVHRSNSSSHASGFVKVNGVLFGGGSGTGE